MTFWELTLTCIDHLSSIRFTGAPFWSPISCKATQSSARLLQLPGEIESNSVRWEKTERFVLIDSWRMMAGRSKTELGPLQLYCRWDVLSDTLSETYRICNYADARLILVPLQSIPNVFLSVEICDSPKVFIWWSTRSKNSADGLERAPKKHWPCVKVLSTLSVW